MNITQSANVDKYGFYSLNSNDVNNHGTYISENTLNSHWQKFKNITDLTDPVVKHISISTPSLSYAYGGVLDFLRENGQTTTVSTSDYNWKLRRRNHSYIRTEENLYPGVAYPAIGDGVKVSIVLSVGWILPGTYAWPEANPEYQVIMDTSSVSSGAQGFIYKATKNNNISYMPSEYLQPNVRWCVATGAYSEGSRQYAGFYMHNTGWIEFKGSMWSIGEHYEVTDEAVYMGQNAKGMMAMTCECNSMPDLPKEMYFTYLEGEFLAMNRYNKKKLQWLGEDFAKNAIDSSTGLYRRTGIGLRPLLRYGNGLQYIPGVSTLKHLQNNLNVFWDNKVPHEQRYMAANGGSAFIMWLNEIITEAFKQSGFVADMKSYVSEGGPTYGTGYKGLKYQTAYFTEWVGFPWGGFKALWEPFFDDQSIHGSMLFEGKIIPSYSGVVWDGGMGKGFGNNIRILERKDGYNYVITNGTFTNGGTVNNYNSSGQQANNLLGRMYRVTLEDRFGIYLNDVTLPITISAAIKA